MWRNVYLVLKVTKAFVGIQGKWNSYVNKLSP